MLKHALIGFVCAAAMAGAAYADWKASYNAYQQALQSGDRKAAVRHAGEAWRGAAAALPPSENRALLAQNYAGLVLFTEPAKAVDPLRDAAMLAEQGFGLSQYTAPGTAFLHAYAEAAASPKNRGLARQAAGVAGKLTEKDHRSLDVVMGLQRLAGQQLQLSQEGEVLTYMRPLTLSIIENETASVELVQNTAILFLAAVTTNQPQQGRTGSKFSFEQSTDAFLDNLLLAMKALRNAQNRYSSQLSIEDFDPDLGRAMAWYNLAGAFYDGYASEAARTYIGQQIPRQTSGVPVSRNCNVELRNVNIQWPASQVGKNGAVVLGFHLDRRGRVESARVLGEVPGRSFGEAALRGLKGARADVKGQPEACRRNLTYAVEFYTQP